MCRKRYSSNSGLASSVSSMGTLKLTGINSSNKNKSKDKPLVCSSSKSHLVDVLFNSWWIDTEASIYVIGVQKKEGDQARKRLTLSLETEKR